LGEYNNYIQENDIRTLQGELVKSYEECEIANCLFRQGIVYEYEANYQVNTAGPDYRAYQPIFIYLITVFILNILPSMNAIKRRRLLISKAIWPVWLGSVNYIKPIRLN